MDDYHGSNEPAIFYQFCRFANFQALQRYMFNYSICLIMFFNLLHCFRSCKEIEAWNHRGRGEDGCAGVAVDSQ